MSRTPTDAVANALQEALVDLVDLSLLAKQAHWNIQGPHFRSLHLQLDEVVELVRPSYDDVAERLVAIGGTPDGRATTIAETSKLTQISGGTLATDKVWRQFEELLQEVADRITANLAAVEEPDPLTHDLLVGVATGLEKQAWLFRAAGESS